MVLPETTREGAVSLGERLRSVVESQPFRYEDKVYTVTISLGVAATTGDATLTSRRLAARWPMRSYTRPRATVATVFAAESLKERAQAGSLCSR